MIWLAHLTYLCAWLHEDCACVSKHSLVIVGEGLLTPPPLSHSLGGFVTPFEMLPYSFSPETIDMVTTKYVELQRSNQIVEVDYPTRYRIARLDAILTHMADFPDEIKSDDVVYMATLVLSWVESLFHSEED